MRPFEIYFDEEDVKKNLPTLYIQHMLELGAQLEGKFFDIRVRNEDLGGVAVEVIERYWDSEMDSDKFDYISDYEGKLVVYRIDFPDNHYEYAEDYSRKQFLINEWLKENPEYEYNWEYNYFDKKED